MDNEHAPVKAMIIEDEKDLCFLLSYFLQKKKMATTIANSITEAKQTIFHYEPSLLFIDNNLPDGSGIDFIATIRNSLPDTNIIMISAQNSETDIEKARETGANFFISKPFNYQVIANTLARLSL